MASGGALSPVEEMVERWCEADRMQAFVKSDREVIESTTAVRVLIAEALAATASATEPDRDLLHAFAVLGRLVAERGGSPTLAAAIVDNAFEAAPALGPAHAPSPAHAHAPARTPAALPSPAPAWLRPARAALAEAYALTRLDTSRSEAAACWEYPRCAVGLPDGTVAVAAGFPDDDEEALSAWAGRVAHAAAISGVRRVVASGAPLALAALEKALDLAGITHVPARPPRSR